MDAQCELPSSFDGQDSAAEGVSLSALAVAGSRWLAGLGPRALCDDPWAGELAGPRGRELADRLNGASAVNKLLVGLRTAYFDRQVRHHIADLGFSQIVVLGAGLDTRAARFMSPDVEFFEVDRAETQAYKLRRLQGLAGYPVAAARYVACDFEQDDVLNSLAAAGFAPDRPAFFLMEGLSSYLSEEAVHRLLSALSAHTDPGSRVVFDYLRPRALGSPPSNGSSAAKSDVASLISVAASFRQSEPLRWLCSDPTRLLRALGFVYVRTLPVEHLGLHKAAELVQGIDAKHYSIAHATRTSPATAHVCW